MKTPPSNKYYESLKFFFNDFGRPFIKLTKSLKDKWNKGLRIFEIKKTLIKDVEFIRSSIIENTYTDEYLNEIDKNTIKETRLLELIKKVNIIDRESIGYEETVNKMFESFYSKMDRRILRLVNKIENNKYLSIIEDEDEDSVLSRDEYTRQKIELQIELVKLQEWAIANDKKIAIVFEGRDAAGKGSSIKRFTEYINPKYYRVVALGIPTEEESNNWFERYEKHLPKKGELVFFDRSWYNRAVVEPTMGYCTENQYEKFMNNVVEWENNLIDNDIILIKFWFSIGQEKQLERFELRKKSPLKHWKYSPNDEKTIGKWGVMTKYKEQMFLNTSTPKSPWIVINSNDKRVSRLNSIRYILSKIDYTGKDTEKNILPSSDIVKPIN